MVRFVKKPYWWVIIQTVSIVALPELVFASGFQLWEQDGASIGNYHAGYAAYAEDASTAYYNPAGLTRVRNKQMLIAGDIALTDFKYKGDLDVYDISNYDSTLASYNGIVAPGGGVNYIPAFHYAQPINDDLTVALSLVVPFGMQTDYGIHSPLRYAATLSSVKAVALTPSFGYRLNNHWSIGAGIDIERAEAEMGGVAGATIDSAGGYDTQSMTRVHGVGYGYRLGALYELSPATRIGMSYHSQVVHHLTGDSEYTGLLANIVNNYKLTSDNSRFNITLPAYTAFSAYHRLNSKFALMGSVIHTQWNSIRSMTVYNIAGSDEDGLPSKTLTANIPEHFKNTLNFTAGLDYFATDNITLRGGLGFDQSPLGNRYRDVRMPDSDRYVAAVGTRMRLTESLGLDLGWSHYFVSKSSINPPPVTVGAQTVETHGKVEGGGDVYAAQLVWNIN